MLCLNSSVVGIDLPCRCSGLLMEKELRYFKEALQAPKKPFLAILGGYAEGLGTFIMVP